ncbi:hypothetical protein LXT13_06405 [Pelomonas sp. P8]|uniref:Uncharacterized protein n=1 Tax=Pelomonas cellulosilytica TaxID=2906762 RepID=A0ABS8XT57_9BURK|nr:hypothetical protein [Pelomonas sp. P8]
MPPVAINATLPSASLRLHSQTARMFASPRLQGGGHGGEAHALLNEHIGHASTRIAALQELERELVALRSRCRGDEQACAILEGLAEPGAELPSKSHVGHSH